MQTPSTPDVTPEWVWLFSGQDCEYTVALFSNYSQASLWIEQHQLTGMLTRYPVDQSCYDWAIEHEYFTPKKEWQDTSRFIQGFT